MSVRQYIGARYVPRFSDVNGGVWSNVYAYEPLTIVKNGNDYYTSKQSVPVGVAITNTDYWVKTGDYNGAISALDSRITSNTDTISQILNNASNWKDHKVVFVSDSFGARTYDSITLIALIAARCKINTYYNVQKNGIGFTNINGQGTFLDELTNASGTIPDKSTITDVVVLGGSNDYTTDTDVLSAINTFRGYVSSNYPNAKIHIAHVGRPATSDARLYQTTTQSLKAYRDSVLLGIHYISNSEYIMHRKDFYDVDLVHPTSSAVNSMASQIALGLLTGSCDVQYVQTVSFTPDATGYSASTVQSGNSGNIKISNNLATLTVNPFFYLMNDYGSATTVADTINQTVDIVSNVLMTGTQNSAKASAISQAAGITATSVVQFNCPVIAALNDYKLALAFNVTPYGVKSDVRQIHLKGGFTINAQSDYC